MPNTRDRFVTVHTYLHSGTKPGLHGFVLSLGFLCYCTYDPVCSSTSSMPYDQYMIWVTGTICDTVVYKKIDFYKHTHTVIAVFDLIAQ